MRPGLRNRLAAGARCLLLLALGCSALAAQAAASGLWIGLRYDSSRALLLLESVGPYNVNAPALPDPAAHYGSMASFLELTPGQVGDIEAQAAPDAATFAPPRTFQVGDRFELLLGGAQVVNATVTSLAGYSGNESGYLGALVTIDPAQLSVYRSSRADCFLARAGAVTAAAPTAARTDPPTPTAAALNPIMAAVLRKELPAVAAGDASGSNDGRQAEVNAIWPSLDAALAAGTGVLATQITPVELGGGDGARFYVQALWTVNGRPAFLCSAWLDPTPGLHLVSDDIQPATAMRIAEYGADPPGMDLVPQLLNAVDLGDGRTALVMFRETVADSGITVQFYSDTGPTSTSLVVGDGN